MRIAFLFLLLSFSAFAGIRGVGLGGGHGEMQAFLADRRLPQILKGLGDGASLPIGDTRPLRPDPTCRAPAEEGTVYISSCDLYEFNAEGEIERAKPFAEILAVVYSARTGKPLRESRALFGDLEVLNRVIALTPRDAELKLRYMEVKHRAGRFSSLIIEGQNGSVDLDNAIEEELLCGENPDWRIGQIQAFSSPGDSHMAQIKISWSCGREHFEADLHIHVHYPDGRLAVENIDLRLFNKRLL